MGIETKIAKDLAPAGRVAYERTRNIAAKFVLWRKKLVVEGLENFIDNDPCFLVISHMNLFSDVSAPPQVQPERTLFYLATDQLLERHAFRKLFKRMLHRRYPGLKENALFAFSELTFLYPLSVFLEKSLSKLELIPVKVAYSEEDKGNALSGGRVCVAAKQYLMAGRTLVIAPMNQQRIPSEIYPNMRQFMPGAAIIVNYLHKAGYDIPVVPLAMYGRKGIPGRRGTIVMKYGKPIYATDLGVECIAKRIIGDLSELEQKLEEQHGDREKIVVTFSNYIRQQLEIICKSRLNEKFKLFVSYIQDEFARFCASSPYSSPHELMQDFARQLNSQADSLVRQFSGIYNRLFVDTFTRHLEKTVGGLFDQAKELHSKYSQTFP